MELERSRVELDQRARDARLRLERLERLLLPRAAVTRFPLRWLLYLCSGVFASASRESRVKRAAEQSAAFAHADHS